MILKIAVSVILTAAIAARVLASQSADPIEELFARGRAMQASIRTLSASFTETTRSSLLVRPIVTTGTLVAAINPLRVVMRYTAPDARTIWIDEQALVVAQPNRPIEEIGIATMQRRVQKYFAAASYQELRENFEMTLTNPAGPPPAYLLEMAPRRRQIKEGLVRLRLWIDRERMLMTRLQMDFPGDDSKTIELSDLKTNVPVDDSTFARPKRSGRGALRIQ